MDYMMRSVVLACTIAIASLVINAKDVPIDRFAVHGGTIHLRCDLPISDDPDVEWVDKVYGSEQNPELIFHSRNNSHFGVSETHQNGRNYRVDRDFTLRISDVDVDSDVGQYTCRSRTGDRTHRKRYYLTIGDLPSCSGETDLRSGEETSLSCEMAYSGRNPNLEWLEDGKTISSVDEYEIRLAKKVVNVHTTHRHNGLMFQCQMTIGSTTHACNLTLNVTYGVLQPKFHPIKESFEPGEELKCVAKGNPPPSVTLLPDFPGSVEGSGWSALVVEETWIGRQIQVQCSASNVIDGVEHVNSQNVSFNVLDPRRMEHHHHHHQQQQQHSTVPIVLIQDEERKQIAPGDHLVEEENPAATLEQKPQDQPKPNVKPVHSTGNLTTFSMMVVILSLISTVLV